VKKLLIAAAFFLTSCADLQMASRRALFDASMATPQTQAAYRDAMKAIEEIDAEDERAVGESVALRIVAGSMKGEGQITGLNLSDRDLAAYVSNVGNLVALQGRRQLFGERKTPRTRARRFVFAILDTEEIGAFSTPGGYVFVSRGLLGKLETESELAWVLGHEIAHVDYEDGLAALKASLGTNTAMGSLGDSLKGRPKSESAFKDQKFFNGVVDKLSGIYLGSGLAREAEMRADRNGLEYSTKAGYDGAGAQRALEHLDLGHSFGGFLTHGSKAERRSAMLEFIEKPGKTGAMRYDRNCAARVEALPVPLATGGTP
jgi:predicted Zn-dependent protease